MLFRCSHSIDIKRILLELTENISILINPPSGMSLKLLPDEIVTKILGYLADDPRGFIGLASSCRRFHYLLDKFVNTPDWTEKRPLTFNFYLDPSSYLEQNVHQPQGEEQQQTECNCTEFKYSRTYQPDVIGRYNGARPTGRSECYRRRITCWLNSKRRRFSTLRFKGSNVYNSICIRDTFGTTLNSNLTKQLAETNIKYLVSLEILDCCTTVRWLVELLKQLPNVAYLKLDSISYRVPDLDHDCPNLDGLPGRPLKWIKMGGNIPLRIFNYLLDGYPANELDLTNLAIRSRSDNVYWPDHGPRLTIRLDYYPEPQLQAATSGISVMAVVPYLLKQQKTVQHLIADLEPEAVLKILQHDQLDHLRLTVNSTNELSHSWNDLTDRLDRSQMERLKILSVR